MAGILDTVQRASFQSIAFACERYSCKGGLRESVHEYRHTPGGQPEIQGRRLYTFDFETTFSSRTPDYPNAWPDSWDSLRIAFEQGTVADLVVPTLGTIKAYCIDWPCDVDFKKMRDGLRAHLTFREDQQTLFSAAVDTDINAMALPNKGTALVFEAEEAGVDVSIFDAIMNLLADIEAAKGFYEFQVEQYLDKVTALVDMCQRIEAEAVELAEPKTWKVTAALMSLGVSAIRIREDILRKLRPIILFPVPALMSILDVSVSLYGDTSRAVELMNLNRDPTIAEPFSITPGTVLRAYAPAA